MENDKSKSENRYPISTSKMSKTPSWIMLGFLLGAAFVIALPPLRKTPVPEPVTFKAAEPPKPREPREPPQMTTIEAVFAEWGRHAVWSDNTTEVALWNSHDNAYSDFYDVRRFGDVYYFRSIPRLTRRIIARGKPIPDSPLQFTETEEQYREWLNFGRAERPVEREMPARPRASAPPPDPKAVERAVNIVPPTLPPPEFPPRNGAEK